MLSALLDLGLSSALTMMSLIPMAWADLNHDGSGHWRFCCLLLSALFLFFQVDLDAKYPVDLPPTLSPPLQCTIPPPVINLSPSISYSCDQYFPVHLINLLILF